MANSSGAVAQATAVPVIGQGRWARWLTPSFFDLFVLALPAWVFLHGGSGWQSLLSDGDTGWHISTGRWILEHGSVPRADPFSFTKFGEPWFAWEWLADVVYALLNQAWGLKGVLLLSAGLFTVFAAVLFRHLLWRGANLFIALPLTLVGAGVATAHLLARPHLFTLALLPACLWLVFADLRAPTRWIWALVPATVLWANLHGGWLALVGSLGVLAVGLALEARLRQRDWSAARRYAWLTVCCTGASLVNPYGWRLHAHVWSYLRSDWIREAVVEFQSPKFRGELMLQYEAVLLAALLCAGLWMRRWRVAEPLLVLFWAHLSLGAVRHVPLFVLVALPMLAEECGMVWRRWVAGLSRLAIGRTLEGIAQDFQPATGRTSPWILGVASLMWLPLAWPTSFPEDLFPVGAVERHRALIRTTRLLTTDEWADYLLYANYPDQRVFIDGRSDFYGEPLGREYLGMLNGSHDWRRSLRSHRIDVVLLPPRTALVSLLKESEQWQVVEDDGAAVLLRLRETQKAALPPNEVR